MNLYECTVKAIDGQSDTPEKIEDDLRGISESSIDDT